MTVDQIKSDYEDRYERYRKSRVQQGISVDIIREEGVLEGIRITLEKLEQYAHTGHSDTTT